MKEDVDEFCGFCGFEMERAIVSESNEKLLLDVNELSALTGIAVGTIYHWVSEGRLPCVRLSARCLRFSLPAIREWLAGLNKPADTRNCLKR